MLLQIKLKALPTIHSFLNKDHHFQLDLKWSSITDPQKVCFFWHHIEGLPICTHYGNIDEVSQSRYYTNLPVILSSRSSNIYSIKSIKIKITLKKHRNQVCTLINVLIVICIV